MRGQGRREGEENEHRCSAWWDEVPAVAGVGSIQKRLRSAPPYYVFSSNPLPLAASIPRCFSRKSNPPPLPATNPFPARTMLRTLSLLPSFFLSLSFSPSSLPSRLSSLPPSLSHLPSYPAAHHPRFYRAGMVYCGPEDLGDRKSPSTFFALT